MKAKHRARAAAALTAAALALMLYFGKNALAALFDESNAVHIDPASIENSTLIIGTHLIYLHSLNQGIYEIAVQSAADSGQYRRYYKSELAGGLWMDITDAGSISDISAGGTVAGDGEIAGLYLTHHTRSDGITYDLRTAQPVCVYSITDVYDLEHLPELEALKLRYDEMRNYDINSDNISLVTDFFATEFDPEKEQKYDMGPYGQQIQAMQQYEEQIQALQGYYQEMAANNGDSRYLETALAVMEKVSNARKAQVFTIVGEILGMLQNDAANAEEVDDALLTAIGESQYALEESMAEAEGNMLAEQDSVISKKEYELCTDMIADAEAGNYFACDGQNIQLQLLEHISSGRIVHGAEELALLEELTASAETRYSDELSKGVTPEYQMLVNQNASHAARENRRNADMAGAAAVRGELEFLIQGTVDRRESIGELAGEETQKYILQKIQEAARFKSAVKQDDYAESYQDSVTGYVGWLNDLLSGIKQAGGGQEETLYEQKADLQEQKLKALDALDLDTAKRIDARIADVDEEIRAQEAAQSEKLQELTERKAQLEAQLAENPRSTNLQLEISNLEAQLAAGQAALPDSSQAANILESKNEILGLLAEGDTGDAAMRQLEDGIDRLASLLEDGSPLALASMKEVYGKMIAKAELGDVSAYDDMLERIEAAVSESAVSTGLTDALPPERVADILADALRIQSLLAGDGSIDPEGLAGASGEALSAALVALGEYQETGDGGDSTAALAQGLASALEQSAISPVFQTTRKEDISYVPAEVLAGYLGYRYVWNDTKRSAVLSKGREFFRFQAYSDQVETQEGEALSMDRPAFFSGELFLPDSFVQQQFGCHAVDIAGTDYSVLVDDKVVERAQDILSELEF